MIFKAKDSLEPRIKTLDHAINSASSQAQRRFLEKELNITRAGEKGEKEAAYYIDFELAQKQNWAVIHDLRLEWNGRVAQIDHLLIDVLLEVYVVESKSFRSKVQYANGGWERWVSNRWEGIPSPVEQNERHIAVLKELITDARIAPSRLGVRLTPSFFNVVLVQPSCSIMGSPPPDARIFRADAFVRKIRNEDPSTLSMLKIVNAQTLHSFATSLLAFHKPGPSPSPVKDTAAAPATVETTPRHPSERCQACNGPISPAEAKYCRSNSRRFAGQLLCRKCQNLAPRVVPPSKPSASLKLNESPVSAETPVARCAECGAPVDAKVVAFCRFNSKRLNRRTLCRKCQTPALSS